MEGREVWITGAGMITPLGEDLDATWEGVRAGRTGIARHSPNGNASLPENFLYYGAVEGHEDPPEVPPKLASQRKFLNRGSTLGLYAANDAIERSGADLGSLPPERKSLYVASGDFTQIDHLDLYQAVKETAGDHWKPPDPAALNEAVLHKVNPFFLLEGLANNPFSFLSALYEMMGPNGSISSLSSCGGQAVEFCDRAIRYGEADLGLVVGCGSWVSPFILFEVDGCGMLSKAAKGASSFRPFDRGRDGFLTGEGGAALLLEPADAARARGAEPIGRLLGTGNTHEIDLENRIPVPRKAIGRACAIALAEAGLAPSDLSHLILHGSATKKGDHNELAAARDLLGGAAGDVPLVGLKPYTGHMGAASDIGELIFGLCALRDGRLPPTPGFDQAEAGFGGLCIPKSSSSLAGGPFLSISYGIGGQTSATVVGAP